MSRKIDSGRTRALRRYSAVMQWLRYELGLWRRTLLRCKEHLVMEAVVTLTPAIAAFFIAGGRGGEGHAIMVALGTGITAILGLLLIFRVHAAYAQFAETKSELDVLLAATAPLEETKNRLLEIQKTARELDWNSMPGGHEIEQQLNARSFLEDIQGQVIAAVHRASDAGIYQWPEPIEIMDELFVQPDREWLRLALHYDITRTGAITRLGRVYQANRADDGSLSSVILSIIPSNFVFEQQHTIGLIGLIIEDLKPADIGAKALTDA